VDNDRSIASGRDVEAELRLAVIDGDASVHDGLRDVLGPTRRRGKDQAAGGSGVVANPVTCRLRVQRGCHVRVPSKRLADHAGWRTEMRREAAERRYGRSQSVGRGLLSQDNRNCFSIVNWLEQEAGAVSGQAAELQSVRGKFRMRFVVVRVAVELVVVLDWWLRRSLCWRRTSERLADTTGSRLGPALARRHTSRWLRRRTFHRPAQRSTRPLEFLTAVGCGKRLVPERELRRSNLCVHDPLGRLQRLVHARRVSAICGRR